MGAGAGVVLASALTSSCRASTSASTARTGASPSPSNDFFFLQLSDTHVGYDGPANPDAHLTLERTVAAINAVEAQPDFIVFTGDLTHMTADPKERRARLARFQEIVSGLRTKTLRFLPGEHDAAADHGEAFTEAFGASHWSFDHGGVHVVGIDNVSLEGGAIGDAQLAWLESDLAAVGRDTRVVVLTHRPLFDLYPAWEWATKDGARAIEILQRHPAVTVFYGHVHQEHHHVTGAIAHHAARSLVFPLPPPPPTTVATTGAAPAPKRVPLPWDPASRDHGLGHRSVALATSPPPSPAPRLTEIPYAGA